MSVRKFDLRAVSSHPLRPYFWLLYRLYNLLCDWIFGQEVPGFWKLLQSRVTTSKFLSFGRIFPKDSTGLPQTDGMFSTDAASFSTENHGINWSCCSVGDIAIWREIWVKVDFFMNFCNKKWPEMLILSLVIGSPAWCCNVSQHWQPHPLIAHNIDYRWFRF